MLETSYKKYSTIDERIIARNMAENNFSHSEIAAAITKSESTVRRILARYKERGNDENLPSGRPKKILSERGLRHLKRDIEKEPRQTLGEITENINNGLQATGSSISTQTIQRAIHNDLHMSSCHARLKPNLLERHILVRRTWAQELHNWTLQHWKKVIWTDEMTFEVGKNYRLVLVWRPPGQQYNPKYLAPTFKSGRSTLMVWGAIAHVIPGPLVKMPKGQCSALDYIRIVMWGPLGHFFEAVLSKNKQQLLLKMGLQCIQPR